MAQFAKKVELFFLKHSPLKILGKALKYIITVAALGYLVLLLLRLFSSGDTALAKTYIWTEDAIAAAETESLRVKEIVVPGEYSDGRREGEHLFRIRAVFYTENTAELQATLRFNDSVERAADDEFGTREGERFLFVLRDNLGNLYPSYRYLSDEKNVLNYRRVVFSGIKTEEVTSFDLLVYHVTAPNATEPYAIFPACFKTLQAYAAADIGTPPTAPTAGLIAGPQN